MNQNGSQLKLQEGKMSLAILICIMLKSLWLVGSEHSDNYLAYPDDYKTNSAPLADSDDEEIFTLSIDIEVWAIAEVSLQKQLIEVDLRVSIEWLDFRLKMRPNITSDRTWLLLSEEDKKTVWKPTLLFRNCKGCSPLSFDHKSNTELYIDQDKTTFFARFRTLDKFTCAIDLRAYPMDIQTCPVQLYVYEETNDALRMNHTHPKKPAIILSNMTLSEFFVPPITKTDCTFTEEDETYSCLEIRIQLEHLVLYHLMTSYAPTSFIVILSWISFWLPVEMAPARVALGLTSLLTLATRLDQAQKDLPPVAYVKAIDVWMFACIFLVSTSLCEFAISHYRWRLDKTAPTTESLPIHSVIKPDFKAKLPTPCHTSSFNTVIQIRSYMEQRSKVAPIPPCPPPLPSKSSSKDGTSMDRISRVAFPFFLLFNIIYRSHYLTYYS